MNGRNHNAFIMEGTLSEVSTEEVTAVKLHDRSGSRKKMSVKSSCGLGESDQVLA
jgi:hypothetical protein